ncbi:MAG: hypothetical protein ABIT08_13285 [Bacteroidia bacterium]
MSFVFQYRLLQTFHSSVSLIVNETDVTDLNGPSQFIGDFINTNASSVNRIFKFAYSSEMMDHLIKKFNLYKYYQIDPTQTFAYEKVISTLSNRIHLHKSEPTTIVITVTDRDRFQAASIANEIALMLNTINENYLKKQLKRKVALYEGIYLNVTKELDQHENQMIKILDSYKSIINTLEKNKGDVESMKYALIDLTTSLKSKREELIKVKQTYALLLETFNKEHLETITIINTALPDHTSNTNSILIVSFVFALIAVCSMIVVINIYLTNKKYVDLIFKK